MSYIVHITDNCLKNAQYHNTTKGLESLKQVFMDTDDFRLHNLEHRSNGKGIFVKKKFPKKNGRLIIWYRKIGNHQVIIFIAICNVGENDFKKFNHDPIKFVEPFVDEELIERDIIDQTKKLPKKKKPDVKGIEKFLLDQSPIEDSIKPDNWMGETQMWIEAWENEVNRTMLSTVKEKVEDIVTSGKRDIFSIEVGNDKLLYYKNLYIDYRTKDEALILIAFIDNKTQARKEVEKKYEDILLHEDSQSIDSFKQIQQKVKRVYDWDILSDGNKWINMQMKAMGSAANLNLTPEEIKVLDQVKNSYKSESETGYPLFISGRAGSGKSTMLQYIMSYYILFYLSKKNEDDELATPVYFASSSSLIDKSSEAITEIVRAKLKEKSSGEIEIKETVANSLKVFYDYLFSLLPDEEKESFRINMKCGYSSFRRMWESNDHFINSKKMKEIGPDKCWHIIRTYIKGYTSEKLVTPEIYKNDVSRKLKNISDNDFELIYTEVYEKWYKTTGLWDQQDLVRYLLDNSLIKQQYLAIFCDEAQDFTRIEIELFLKLSTYTSKNLISLRPNQISRIPIGFAGDEFQTLNPTGFQWEQVKAALVEKLLKPLYMYESKYKDKLNYRELKSNYRSSKQIVKLCNLIQLCRYSVFKAESLPQDYWGDEYDKQVPTWFDHEDNTDNLINVLKENEELEIIIPVLKGEESEYRNKETFLNNITVNISSNMQLNDVISRVYSPERVKGLEKSKVIVYNFGEHYIKRKFKGDIFKPDNQENNPDLIELGHFMNQLYVAISRAKDSLYIIDTKRGIEQFWKKMISPEQKNIYLNNIDSNSSFIDNWKTTELGTILQGNINEIKKEENIVDSKITAEENEKEGLLRKDFDLLLKAHHSYKNASRHPKYKEDRNTLEQKATICKGKAYLISGNYLDAAKEFELASDWENAVEAHWQRQGKEKFDSIISCSKKNKDLIYKLEVILAEFQKILNPSFEDYYGIFEDARRLSDHVYIERFRNEKAWQDMFNEILRNMLAKFGKDEGSWENLAKIVIHQLQQKFIYFDKKELAMLHYYGEDYDRAEQYFEETNYRQGEYEMIQLINEKNTRNRIEIIDRIIQAEFYKPSDKNLSKLYKNIIKEYESSPKQIKNQNLETIAVAYEKIGRESEANKLWFEKKNIYKIYEYIKDTYSNRFLTKKEEFYKASGYFMELNLLNGYPSLAFNYAFGNSEIIEDYNGVIGEENRKFELIPHMMKDRGRTRKKLYNMLGELLIENDIKGKVSLLLYWEFLLIIKANNNTILNEILRKFILEACKQGEYDILVKIFTIDKSEFFINHSSSNPIKKRLNSIIDADERKEVIKILFPSLIRQKYKPSKEYHDALSSVIYKYALNEPELSLKQRCYLMDTFAKNKTLGKNGFYTDNEKFFPKLKNLEKLYMIARQAKRFYGLADAQNRDYESGKNADFKRKSNQNKKVADKIVAENDLDRNKILKYLSSDDYDLTIGEELILCGTDREFVYRNEPKLRRKNDQLKISNIENKTDDIRLEKKMKTSFVIEGIEFTYLVDKKRINMQEEDSGNMAFIKLNEDAEIEVSSIDVDIDGKGNRKEINEWNIVIENDQKSVKIYYKDLDGFEMNYSF